MKPKEDKVIVLGDIYEENGHDSAAGRVYDGEGIAPTLGASHFAQIKLVLIRLAEREKERVRSWSMFNIPAHEMQGFMRFILRPLHQNAAA